MREVICLISNSDPRNNGKYLDNQAAIKCPVLNTRWQGLLKFIDGQVCFPQLHRCVGKYKSVTENYYKGKTRNFINCRRAESSCAIDINTRVKYYKRHRL